MSIVKSHTRKKKNGATVVKQHARKAKFALKHNKTGNVSRHGYNSMTSAKRDATSNHTVVDIPEWESSKYPLNKSPEYKTKVEKSFKAMHSEVTKPKKQTGKKKKVVRQHGTPAVGVIFDNKIPKSPIRQFARKPMNASYNGSSCHAVKHKSKAGHYVLHGKKKTTVQRQHIRFNFEK